MIAKVNLIVHGQNLVKHNGHGLYVPSLGDSVHANEI